VIPESEWIWDGHQAHLRVTCEFHLATRVGDYIVSTVGEYRPQSGRADGAQYGLEYARFETIGSGRLFETFVFRTSGEGLGTPDTFDEVDTEIANDHNTARLNHMAMCRKYAGLSR